MTRAPNDMDEHNDNKAAALTWRPLIVFDGYRAVVATLLFVGFLVGTIGAPDGVIHPADPLSFTLVAAAYLAVALLLLGCAARRTPPFLVQVVFGVLVDIGAIAALIHTLGSQESGLGILMISAVAGGSLLGGVRLGAFFAASGTIALFAVHTLALLSGQAGAEGFTQAALLGIGIFATSLSAALLARRARESEALAAERGVDVANLQALNAHIVQRLETGVIALDRDDHIRFANRTASPLTGAVGDGQSPRLDERSAALATVVDDWRNRRSDSANTPIMIEGEEFMPRILPLEPEGRGGSLIFLENLTEMRAQVQQAKLAAMGRLTASIAHEVRNPLGAMMQAAQLLEETDNLAQGERRMLDIILKQGRRLNETVENVLQLSRRAPADREPVELHTWAKTVAEEWRAQQGPKYADMALTIDAEPAEAPFDSTHLRQVLENLLRNAVDHGGDPPQVRIATGYDARGAAYLEVADNGPGIDAEIREHLFEPFATSRRDGTGLGLYLARELCEASRARIELVDATHGACFRITFARTQDEQQGATG
ncbi:sensor histidine kinase [Arhodomonas sp. AD133]|uniref:sensor histidine kinase n=1 Tax=Arhodomonas sp. AD133 TaxID=3415009 RepID=UPI003EB825BD